MRKYHGESVPEKHEEKTRVSKAHFLVHPGFVSTKQKFKESTTPEAIELLHQKYLAKARSLKDDEIMFAFVHALRKKDQKSADNLESYRALIKELKGILKSRLIVLSDNPNKAYGLDSRVLPIGASNGMPIMKKLLDSRGFYTDEDTLSEVYGELIAFCTTLIGSNLNTEFGFKHPTPIKTHLTDMSMEVTLPGQYLHERYKKKDTSNAKPWPENVYFDFNEDL